MCLEHRLREVTQVERDAEFVYPRRVLNDGPMPVLSGEVNVDVSLEAVDIDPITPVSPRLEISGP
jgi:hypothetical protein